jgi:hypothetical protein
VLISLLYLPLDSIREIGSPNSQVAKAVEYRSMRNLEILSIAITTTNKDR